MVGNWISFLGWPIVRCELLVSGRVVYKPWISHQSQWEKQVHHSKDGHFFRRKVICPHFLHQFFDKVQSVSLCSRSVNHTFPAMKKDMAFIHPIPTKWWPLCHHEFRAWKYGIVLRYFEIFCETFLGLHPGKLTWQWKTNHLKIYLV